MTTINPNLGDSGVPTYGPGPSPGAVTMQDVANRGAVGPRNDFASVSQRIDAVLRIGLSHRPRGEFAADSALLRAQRYGDGALALLGTFAKAVKDLYADPDLTPQGRAKRLAAVGVDALKRLDDLTGKDTMLPALRKMLDRASEAVRTAIKLPPGDDVISFLREREVRDRLYAMGDSARLEAWTNIVGSRDPVGIAAVVNAPRFAPLLNARVVEEGIRQVSESSNPDAAKQREAAESAVAAIEAMRDDVRSMIATTAGVDIRPARVGLKGADGSGALA